MRRAGQPGRTRTLARVWWWGNSQRKLRGRGLDQQPCWIHGDMWRQRRHHRAVHRTDACGHTVTTTATFSVVDTIVPEWNEALPPSYMEVECGSAPEPAVLTVTDNCGFIPVEFNETVGYAACPGDYTITRTWYAEDPCGNSVFHEQVIQVTDTEAPVIDIPADVTVECSDMSAFEEVTVEDNCTATPTSKCKWTPCPGLAPTTS